MPLDAKRKVHQTRSADEIENPHEECYMMRATGELFVDYEEYLSALFQYQTRQWSCSITGKGGGKYTYEEAQMSERSAQRRVDNSFPEIFLEPLCRMVHMSQRRMDELTESIFKRLSCFRNGESVEWVQADGRSPVLVRIVRPVEVDEDFFIDVDPEAQLPTRYIVTTGNKASAPQAGSTGGGEDSAATAAGGDGTGAGESAGNGAFALSGSGDASGGEGGGGEEEEEFEVSCNDLRRMKGQNVSRMTIKSKLKTVGSRENYWQAPFICEDEIVKKLGLQGELPPHIRRLKLANDVKTGKIKKEELAVLDPGLAEERAKKRRRRSSDKDESDPSKMVKSLLKGPVQKKIWEATSIFIKRHAESVAKSEDKAVAPVTVHDVAAGLYGDWSSGDVVRIAETVGTDISIQEFVSTAHSILSELLAVWPSDADRPLLMPPVEDSMLPVDASLQPRPEPLTSFFVPDTELVLPAELLGKTLLVFDFTTRFGKLIKMSPFHLEDLVGAICHEQESNLSRELHCSLLRYLLQQHYEEIRAKEEERRRKERNREREAAGDLGGGEVEGDVLKFEGKKKSSRASVDKDKGGLKARSSAAGVSEKVAGKEEEEEPEELEWEEEGEAPMPKASAVDDFRWAETMVRYMHARARMKDEKNGLPQSVEQQGPAISTAPEDLIAALTQGGYETMETAQRVQLLVYLCEDACETAAINRHLDEAIEETRELSNEMREEEKKLREQKKQAKLEKAKAKEQAMNTLKNDGDDDKKEDEDEKPKEKETAALKKAKLAETKEKMREEDAKLEEQEKALQENLKKTYENELEKYMIRVLPLGSDRDRRTYWLLSSRDCRIFVHDPLHDGVPEAARAEDADGAVKAEELQAWPNAVEAGAAGGAVVSKADGADFSEGAAAGSNVQRTIVPAAKVRPTQGGKGMDWRVWPGGPPGTGSGIGDFGSGQSESWGFYDRADQVDALLAYLNPQGLREGLLYEQLSLRYLKLTGNMRKKASESVKAEREQVAAAAARRSTRIATDLATKQVPFMIYRNTLRTDARGRKSR
eukprot:Tamp_03252.p1 GENE.Tamp_03252~~Tamp_03252.p1  ORF type:complete len:1069 (-),score=328.91 Tamp_03252:626-3757(-)